MKLRRLTIAGFGRLSGHTLAFADGLNVVYGPNEAGKSTVAAAIVASLYGSGRRKEHWRPWDNSAYATTLFYELSDGRSFEVQRDYNRDAKGVHVYDRDGNDVAGDVAMGKTIAPGEVHLRIPHDAFVNASCVLQQSVEIDADHNVSIATALARALDGGPKEDAALGAVKRLEDARRLHVGTPRSTVNNPLRALRDALAEREREARAARETRDALTQLRERRAVSVDERARCAERFIDACRERDAMRAAELRSRLDQLAVYRNDLIALQAARAEYDDVAAFPAERIPELDEAFYAWQSADAAAAAAETDAANAQLSSTTRLERADRLSDAGALDDVEFAALRGAAETAANAHLAATAAANEAAAARRDGSGGRELAGITVAVAGVFAVITIATAIAHWWSFVEVCGAIAAIAFGIVAWRGRERLRATRAAAGKQRIADAALTQERAASETVTAVLKRLNVASVGELERRRDRLAELDRMVAASERAGLRAAEARALATRAADVFDRFAGDIVPETGDVRSTRRAIAVERARRRGKRDGLESGIAMLGLQRSEILRDDDEFALEAERDALAAAGITPAPAYGRMLASAIDARIAEIERTMRQHEITITELSTELNLREHALGNLAPLEEEIERMRIEIARLEALDRALRLAEETITRHTHEAHQEFARRLESYAADALRNISGGRYGEIRVDPATLVVRARVPETGTIVNLESLSAGTRDQVYLIVRLAMAQIFAEGLELPPLLLDDPFAYWDAGRIERCLPIITHNAFGAQTILFTSSAELAAAFERVGATRIDLMHRPVGEFA